MRNSSDFQALSAGVNGNSGPAVPILRATHGDEDSPLRLAGIEIPCYVLEDGRRVVTQSGMIGAMGMSHGGAGGENADRLGGFCSGSRLNPFVDNDLLFRIRSPIPFQPPRGRPAFGYEATILADLCECVLKARDASALQANQLHIAKQCDILIRGFARVGIVALVDEATGYQNARARDALQVILEQYVSKELAKWSKTFPDEFYEQMFRLQGWRYDPGSSRRPMRAAELTVDLVYDRLAPGVLAELRRLTPRTPEGRNMHKLHQRLTEDVGHARLREHLSNVTSMMRGSLHWLPFYATLSRSLPSYNRTTMLAFDYPE